jgi:hypothetical protein
VYAEVPNLHVASEIEYEHGGAVAGDEETDGEIKVEFATVDLKAADALNLRAGVILSPLGRLNVFHDAPMLDLTDRPLVDRDIIPTTLSEAGVGFFGQIFPSEQVVLERGVPREWIRRRGGGFERRAPDSGGPWKPEIGQQQLAGPGRAPGREPSTGHGRGHFRPHRRLRSGRGA